MSEDRDGDTSMTTAQALDGCVPATGADILDEFLAPLPDAPGGRGGAGGGARSGGSRPPGGATAPSTSTETSTEDTDILAAFSGREVALDANGNPYVKPSARDTGHSSGGERLYTESDARLGAIERYVFRLCKSIETPAEFKTAMTTLRKIVGNIHNSPSNAKFRRLRLNNEALVRRLFRFDGARDIIRLLGFVPESSSGSSADDDSSAGPSTVTSVGHSVSGATEVITKPADEWVSMPESAYDRSVFQQTLNAIDKAKFVAREKPITVPARNFHVYYKSTLTRFKATQSKLATDDSGGPSSSSGTGFGDEEMKYPSGSSSSSISSRSTSKSSSSRSSPAPAETEEERKLRLQALRDTRLRSKLANPTKLMSVEKHKELLGIKAREFEKTVIQIEFPSAKSQSASSSSSSSSASVSEGSGVSSDSLIFELTMNPRETVEKLYGMITECLDATVMSARFSLILPPREELTDPSKTLKQMGMIPACIVRFKSSVGPGYDGCYIKKELFDHLFTEDLSHLAKSDAEAKAAAEARLREEEERKKKAAAAAAKKKKRKPKDAALAKMFRLGGR